jgi:uncharacterized protein (TIGR02147 family)
MKKNTEMNPTQKSIFAFTDYRDFIRFYFSTRKRSNPAFSHRVFARQAGFKTSNFMHLVMAGKRNLTKDSMTKIAIAMKLKKREWEYLENLVFYCQSETVKDRELYLTRLNTIRKGAFFKQLGGDHYEYIANWLNPVVRELAGISGRNVDESRISARIAAHVTPAEVRKSLNLLMRLGMLTRTADGGYKQTDSLLSTGPGITGIAAAQYHIGTMALAAEAIERFKSQEREFVGMTLGVSRQTFERIRERMWEFRQEVLAMADDPSPEQVYQLSIQLFPMTKGKK